MGSPSAFPRVRSAHSSPPARRLRLCLSGLVLLVVLAGAGSCRWWGGVVRIGFCGPLTGFSSDLGVQGRGGAILAVEELNAAGGVAGRLVELVVADETDSPEGAGPAVHELAQQGAAVVVGLMSSAAAVAGLPAAREQGLTVVSPTASSTALTGREDAFFRVIPDARDSACELSRHAFRREGATPFLLFLDQRNRAFGESFTRAFADCLAGQGGRVAGVVSLPGDHPDARLLARQAGEAGAGAVLAVCSPRSLASLLRELRPVAPGLHVYSSFWGFTPEFLDMAGSAAEGVVTCLPCPPEGSPSGDKDFSLRFRKRFGYPPSFAAAQSYEAVRVAARALERTGGSRRGMARALADLGRVPGLAGDIAMDRFGDVHRPLYCVQVRDGRPRLLEEDHE